MTTVLDALVEALERKARTYNPNDQEAPAVLLWPDGKREWEPVLPKLRTRLPQLLTLGDFRPEEKRGPAIWIRCMIARALPEADWDDETIPIVYMPGVSRHELRAVEDCPLTLQPLCELQYRGVWFTHENTRDWTVYGFLTAKREGLALEIDASRATRKALANALSKLLETPVEELRGRRLYAEDFQKLLHPDPIRELLRWLNAPEEVRKTSSREAWRAFCATCRERFGFDPERDGELVAAEHLGTSSDDRWGEVWNRFCEAPRNYPHIPERLRRAKPEGALCFHPERWPQCNEEDEDRLRAALQALASLDPKAAAERIAKLETEHGERRSWVWAELDQAPLARALAHLAKIAEAVSVPPGGGNARDLAEAYASHGWKVDAAALDALACVRKAEDVAAIRAALKAVYRPWLEEFAERLWQHVREGADEIFESAAAVGKRLRELEDGSCILFADGLRLDLAKRLGERLREHGFVVEEDWRWAPLPSVTPTAKPTASPISDLLEGGDAAVQEFRPKLRKTGRPVTTEAFRRLLEERGFAHLDPDELGDPSGRAWTEAGEIDRRGHDEGEKLAWRIGEQLDALAERIRSLLKAGWRAVHVVTDHGWLLVPGGLPKVDMPYYLVESRWARCAVLNPGSKVELPVLSWFWNHRVDIVVPRGIGSFRAGEVYAHGGLTLQECVLLDLRVCRGEIPVVAQITRIRWVGLRCRVEVKTSATGLQVDLRTKAAAPETSLLATPKRLDAQGRASIVVENPDDDGRAAVLVVLDADGRVIAKRNTTIGEDA